MASRSHDRPSARRPRPWRLDDRVAVRPEPFGALLYHFGTRRLSRARHPLEFTGTLGGDRPVFDAAPDGQAAAG